jgi:hypothetical protein
MDLVNLTYLTAKSADTGQTLIDFVRHHAILLTVLGIVVGIPLYAIYTVWAFRWSKRQPREPARKDATLVGTGKVLSFKKTNGLDWSEGSRDYMNALDYDGWASRREKRNARYYCKIELAVDIPGREPYVAVVNKPLNYAERAAVKPGMTFQVRVDPNGDPKNVLLELNPAAQPPHAESSD